MTNLTLLNIPENKLKQLTRAKIDSIEQLLLYFPKKYIDRTQITDLQDHKEAVIIFHATGVQYFNKQQQFIKITGYNTATNQNVNILWFNQYYRYSEFQDMIGIDILVAGVAVWDARYNQFQFVNPPVFDREGMQAMGMFPVYKKVPGMADDYLHDCIAKAAQIKGKPAEIIPQEIVEQYQLMSHADMIAQLHFPMSKELLEDARKRLLWDELLYFALRIELNYQTAAKGSGFSVKPLIPKTMAVANSLPYRLTPDQHKTVVEILQHIRSGKRLNALVQGDVGTGKTIVAFLIMFALAESGYQAVIMAPTTILAKQHYNELAKLASQVGIEVAFVSGQKLRKAEQLVLEEGISSGRYKLVVGTQALLSDNYKFKDLGLVVEDEEHKYGVLQRQALTEKAAAGVHIITMSATPIPRSMAMTLYGNNVQLHSILTKPAGRQPVSTGIQSDMDTIYRFIRWQVQSLHHQIYVVCPMISSSNSEKMDGIATAEATYEQYANALGNDARVALVTGKTKKAEAQATIDNFVAGNIDVLVATTVIEVGVSVPNACGIIIHNAERFGLAQLHQLRGRVGRGKEQAFCVLVSDQKDNERLQAMCSTTDGFRIAELDLKQRGAGDFLGQRQSGTERYLAQALANPAEYRMAQAAAAKIIHSGTSCMLLEQALLDNENNVGGDMAVENDS